MAKKDFKKNAAELFINTDAAEDLTQAPEKTEGYAIPKGYRLAKEYKSERMQLLVRPTTKDTIKKLAAAEGLSMNDLVNRILDEYAERQGTI